MARSMKQMMVAAVAMALIGCGGGGGADDRLNGGWGLELNSSCALVLNLDTKAGGYVFQSVCALGGNTFGSELELGDADFSAAGKIAVTPRRTSCPSSDHIAETMTYSLQGSQLALAGASGALVFSKVPSGGSSTAAFQFGCWTMGSFTAHPIQDL